MALLAGALLLAGCEPERPAASGPAAPRFTAMTIDSTPKARSLDDYRGRPLLVNLWATWCAPCQAEMPSLEGLHQAYRGRGLVVVAISIDDANLDPLIREFARERKLTFEILHDASTSVMALFKADGLPQSFLVSRSGRVVATRAALDWASPAARALVDSLLRVQ